jgi:hypothetical protein
MRSDASPAIQLGTNSVEGLLSCDGATTTCSGGKVSAVGGGSSPVNATTVRLTDSQIANLTTVPITIIPAQGANTVIEIVQAMYVYKNVGQSFTGGGAGGLYYNNSSSFQADGGDQQVPIGGSSGGPSGGPSAIGLSYANNNLIVLSGMVNEPVTYSNFNAAYTGSGGENSMVLTVLWISVPSQ